MAHGFSICSYSFRRSFENGSMDLAGYVEFNRRNGFTQLDPWMKHLERGLEDREWLDGAKAMARDAGLPFGCIAVDGGHIYEDSPAKRAACRDTAYRWLDLAGALGAAQLRIDSGGPEELTDPVFDVIVNGYDDLIARAADAGVEILVENHWGPTKRHSNVQRLLRRVDGLGLLFDTNNWAEGTQESAWRACAPHARLTHFKTFSFDSSGNDPSVNLQKAIEILRGCGYSGVWGIESTPRDGNEEGAALNTLALLRRELAE